MGSRKIRLIRCKLTVTCKNAGILGPTTISDTTPSHLLQCFNVNACGPFWAVKYAPAAMSKTCTIGNYPNATPKPIAYGSIIVVSSTASIYGGMWGPAYTMTQHAVLGLVKSSVVQLKGTGIRINIVSSGTIDMGIELSKVVS